MRSLKDRIAALEAGAGANAEVEASPEGRAAYERIFAALRGALPIVPATYQQVDHGTYNTVEMVAPGVSFEELVTGLHRRIEAAALTDDDRRVLAALPSEDLEFTGSSPERVVELFGRLFSAY